MERRLAQLGGEAWVGLRLENGGQAWLQALEGHLGVQGYCQLAWVPGPVSVFMAGSQHHSNLGGWGERTPSS